MQRCPEPDAWFALDADDGALVAHLDGCAECRGVAAMIARAGILDAPPGDALAEGLVPELLPSGAQLGRYVVRGAIGAGGMGVVLEAYDPKLDRRVALKVVRRLRDDASWARAKARVLAEAQAMARLAHPNVIAIHDLVEVGDEQLIAMEHVEGADLEAWLATSPPRHERERVVLDAARGLAAAHDAGVIHCDVKPSNIMVGSDGRTRVTDFGLAALGGEATGGAVGTPGFLAPEVADGAPIDARADQYAFSVTAWRAVFDAEPGERGSGEIARVLARGLERHPAARWRSMHEVVRALEQADRPRARWLLALIPTVAFAIGALLWARNTPDAVCTVDETPLWTPAARAAWIEQMRGVAGAAAETLATDAERVWQTWHDTSIEACGKPSNVTDCLATTRRELDAFIAHAPASKHTSAAQEALANIPSATACLQAPELRSNAVSPELAAARAPFRAALDEVTMLNWLGQYEPARAKLDELVARAPANDPALRGELLYRKADAVARTGDLAGSVTVLEEALQIAERAGNDVARLNTMIELLVDYETLGKTAEANALAKVAEAAAQRIPPDPRVMARLQHVLGSLAYDAGDYVNAERHYQEVVRVQTERLGPSDPEIAGALHDLGLAVHMAGRLDEATAIQQRSLAMFEATVGAKHPDTALPVTELAGLALEQEHLDDAVALYRRSLEIREAALGKDHPYLAESLIGVGRAEAQRDHADEAIAAFRRAVALAAPAGEHHPLGAVAAYRLALELDRRGDAAEATRLLEQSVAAWDANQMAMPEAGYARFELAKRRWKAGDHAGARALAHKAHDVLASMAAPYRKLAQEVEAWIATH